MSTRMLKVLSLFAVLALLFSPLPLAQRAEAVSPDIVISQVYGGGGNSGATYTHDFVELFNRGSVPVSIGGWSVQYASATGTGNFGSSSTLITELPAVTLQPGQYFLVQQAAGAGNGAPLPTPDLVDSTPIAMAAGAGKVALVTDTNSLGCNGGSTPCDAAQLARILDLVGYGSANFFEGAGAAPALNNTTAALRLNGGCTDTDNNAADFTAGAPTPRNTASPVAPCTTPDPVINEFVANHVGTDTNEYIEVHGAPSTDYSAYAVLQIEGDGAGAGVIDSVHAVESTNAGGFWVTDFLSNILENGTLTLLLVEGFTGSLGTDLDTDNDGVFDLTPWARMVDSVAVYDGGSVDVTYASTVLAPGFGGDSNIPGGASRYPDGAATWVRNDFDLAGIPGFTGTIAPGEAYNTPGAANQIYTPPPEACGDPFTTTYAIQGGGLTSPLAGSELAVEGVVVGDFQNNDSPDNGNLNGFHIQDPVGDGDPATSDGLFVFAPGGMDVSLGDGVRVRGVVSEFNGMTEITASQIWLCSTGNGIAPTPVTLPVGSLDDFEPFEGMLVTFLQPLYISEYFNFDRFGEIVLTTERQWTPTGIYEPGSAQQAQLAQHNLLSRITLDDGRTAQNPDPALHPNGAIFDLTNLFRGGDTVQDLTGVLDFSFGLYRIQPVQGADYTAVNVRPPAPDPVGGNVTVAAFNVLNYFTTLNSRGANTPEEFERQRTKIIAALQDIDAAVVGLMEIENNTAAIQDLVAGLNQAMGNDTYAYVDTGVIGSDEIKVAFIYQPAAVSLLGDYAVLDSSVDARFLDSKNRPVLAQTFQTNATGGVFTVAVNHLKSKGSPCSDVGDPDLGDGAGNCNLTRKWAAEALVDWLATDPTGSGDGDFLIIGDLNSYDKEDPIDAILAGPDDLLGTGDDYTDLIYHFLGENAYTYVFNGQLGYLDYSLANASLMSKVTGTTVWHINADEADLIDYDMTFKQPAQDALYEPNAFRSSDHDPVITGLAVCDEIAPTLLVSATPDRLWPPRHQYVDVVVTLTAADNFDPNPTVTLLSVTSNEPDNGLGDGDTPDDIVIVSDTLFQLRAERSGTGSGRIYTITYQVTDACGNSTVASATVTVPFSQGK